MAVRTLSVNLVTLLNVAVESATVTLSLMANDQTGSSTVVISSSTAVTDASGNCTFSNVIPNVDGSQDRRYHCTGHDGVSELFNVEFQMPDANSDLNDLIDVVASDSNRIPYLDSNQTFTGINTFGTPAALKTTVFNGAINLDGNIITDFLDQDNMSSNSASAVSSQQSIKSYVDSKVATVDSLAEVLTVGNTTGGNNIVVTAGDSISVNTIIETTAASGVTIDSVLIKDNTVTATTFVGALTGNATTVTTNANLTGDITSTGNATSIASGVIVNADVKSDAAIAYSKLGTVPTWNQNTSGNAATVTTNANLTGDIISTGNATSIASEVIVNADVKSDAAIAYSKLGAIPTWNQNTTGTAATVTTNANLTGDITSTGNATAIAAGVIINTDIKSDAAIAYSKLGTIPTWNQNTTGTAATVTTANQPAITGLGTIVSLVATTADINDGTVDALIGATSPDAGTFTVIKANTSLELATGATVTGIDNGALGTSATLLATQGAIKTYVDAQTSGQATLTQVLAEGNATGTNDIEVTAAQKIQFRDAAIYINSSADGQLDIVADTEIQIAATTIDVNGAINASTVVATQVDISAQGDLRLQDSSGGEYVAMQAPATLGSSYTLTMPDNDGNNNQVLQTNGSGVLSWVNVSSAGIADGSITTAKLADDGVTSAKLADALDVVTSVGIGGGSSNGVAITQGAIAIKNGGAQSYIDFYCESSNAHYARILAPAHSAFSGNVTLTLPATTSNLVGDTATQTLTNKTLTSAVLNTGVSGTAVLDEDNMASDSATKLATQQSIKAYVDGQVSSVTASSTTTFTNKTINASNNTLSNIAVSSTLLAAGTGISLSTNTLNVDAAQTGITSIYATDLIMGEDAQTAIDFGTANEIDFKVDNAARLTMTSSALYPVTNNQIDLGTASLEFKDAFFDGTVTSDAFAGPLTGNVTGNVSGSAATVTGAAQSNITSLGTLTTLSVDNITIDGNTISTTNTNGNLIITPNGTGNVNINTDTLAIAGTEGESAALALQADESDDNGDEWRLISNTGQTLTIQNNISGSSVAQMTLTPHATVASSTTAIVGLATVGGTLGVTGVVTANAGVVVDEMTLDGDTLTATDDFIVDAVGDINLDAAGNEINLKNNGTTRVTFALDATPEVSFTGGDLSINNLTQDADTAFKGFDGASFITALNLDMSAAGAATFNAGVTATTVSVAGGGMGTVSSDLFVGTGDTTLQFVDGQDVIQPAGSSGAQRSDLISLGDANNKFKDAHFSGTVNAVTLDISGNIDVDGTTNLDVVDIDGAVDMASTLAVTGVAAFDAGTSGKYTAVTSSSNAVSLNLQLSDNFSHDLTENTTISFANPAASGKVSTATLRIIQGSTARTITWHSSIKWAGDTAPTLSTGDDDVDIFVFFTVDGGTTYYGITAGQDMS